MLGSSMKEFGGVLVGMLGDGFLVDYTRTSTGQVTRLKAYYKSRVALKAADGRTSYENKPRIRVEGLSYDEKTMKGDTVTAVNGEYPGRVWKINSGDTSPSGVTTLLVELISR